MQKLVVRWFWPIVWAKLLTPGSEGNKHRILEGLFKPMKKIGQLIDIMPKGIDLPNPPDNNRYHLWARRNSMLFVKVDWKLLEVPVSASESAPD